MHNSHFKTQYFAGPFLLRDSIIFGLEKNKKITQLITKKRIRYDRTQRNVFQGVDGIDSSQKLNILCTKNDIQADKKKIAKFLKRSRTVNK